MNTFLEKLGTILGSVRCGVELIGEVTNYASDRIRARRGMATAHDPMEAALDRILSDAARRVDEAKKDVVVRIAEKNRLRSSLERLTAEVNDLDSVGERENHGRLSAYQARLDAQTAEIESLKQALTEVIDKFEDAKRARGRICVQSRVAQDLQWMNDVARLFEGLAATTAFSKNNDDGS